MRFRLLFILLIGLVFSSCEEQPKRVIIETDYGDMTVELYDSTPKHRDNFIKLVKEGYYDGLLFHRVINKFMIQGGDPESRNAGPDKSLGMGGPGYKIDAEIGAPHIKGALAAARNTNPNKMSSGSQFYIVHGFPQSDSQLDNFEKQKGITYNETQRELYKERGGYPGLDMDYTVFGEVVKGLDVIDKIAAVQTKPGDRPVEDVKMNIRMAN